MNTIFKIILPAAFFLSLILIWEAVASSFQNLTFVLPTPSKIFVGIIDNFDRFKLHTIVTLKEIITGSLLALVIAAPTAFLMHEFKTAKLTIQPLFIISQSIPLFTIAPIMVIWFGWSTIAIIIPTALMVFFPLTLTLYQGLNATPPEWLEFFKLHKASKWQTFTKLSIPYALPHLFSGLKISAAIAAIGAVSAEWTGAQMGLGMLIQDSRRNTDLTTTFGAIFFVILLSLILYLLTMLIERFVCHKKRISSTNKILASLLLLALLVGTTACNQKTLDPKPQTQEVHLLLDWLPNPNHVPLYVGISNNYFAEEGLSLRLQRLSDPNDTILYLTSLQTDLAIYYMPQTLQALERNAQIKVIGRLIPRPLNCILSIKNYGITKASDLNDKVIGFPVGSLSKAYIQELCETHDVHFKDSVRVGWDLIAALSTKQVDVVEGACWNIESEQLRALNLEPSYLPITDFGIPTYEELVILANASISQDIAFVEAFQRALSKSILFCKEHPNEAFAIYLKENPDKMKYTQTWEERAWKNTYPLFADNQAFDLLCWQNFANWMWERKVVSKPLNVSLLQP
ncbi:MAG: ABC transporter substrate-binding protein [Chlamydiales bacterium]|nr:ABC transporter substrate-binding protein [Chlamydiales bacterium]